MKKIVKLTERDLTKLVKRVINEGVLMFINDDEINETLKKDGATVQKPKQVMMAYSEDGAMIKFDNTWYIIGELG